jgi:PAS domain S-box-containing protein
MKTSDLMEILESASDGVVRLDGKAKYTSMNPAAAEVFRRLGRDPEQVIGQSVWQVFPDLKGTAVEREICRALEDEVSIKYEFYYPVDKHWYTCESYATSPGLILVFRDITERKKAPQ